MRKIFRSVLLTGMVAIGVAACGDDVTVVDPPPPPPPPAPAVKSITVTPDGASIQVGGTINMTAAVNADPGVATTVTWSSSDNTKATVVAGTGVVTGVAPGAVGIKATSTVNPAVQGSATLTVVAAPTATVTGVVVTPATASLVVNQTVQLAATVLGTNNPSQTVTWTSLSPTIASVNPATGLVTGLAGGTAVIRATSQANTNFSGTMSVTVSVPNPATVALAALTTGNLATPVNLNAVGGQIEASINVDNGDQQLDRVDVLIGGQVMASQSFGVTPVASTDGELAAAQQTIVLSFNTNQVREVGGMKVPVLFNGNSAATANLYVVGSSTPIASNAIPLVMSNADQALAPATLATDAGALSFTNVGGTWYKSGLTAVYTYLAYSTIVPNAAPATLSAACGATTNPISGTAAAGITVTRTWSCAATEGLRSITGLGGVTYPAGSVGPDGSALTAAAGFSTLGGQFTVAGESRWNVITPLPAGYTLPGPVAVDNLGPSVSLSTVAFNDAFDQMWINASYNLMSDLSAADGGSGVASSSVRLNSTSCATGPDLGSPHGLAETVTSTAVDGYRICGRSVDNLGNVGFSGPSNYFGVDVVAPVIRLAGSTAATPTIAPSTVASVSSVANTTIYSIASPFVATDVWGLEGLDTRSGFNQNAVGGFPTVQTMGFLAPAGTLACGFTNAPAHTNQLMGVLLSDTYVRTNWLAALDCGSALPGYYTYNGYAIDRAGNQSSTIARNFAIDQYAVPNITGLGFAAAFYTPGAPAPFGFSANDDLEIIDATVGVTMDIPTGTAQVLRYPFGSMTALGTRWDGTLTNVINGVTASIPYFLFRIDEMCSAAATPYASCPDPTAAPYNPLLAPYITTSKLATVDSAEYNNAGGNTAAEKLPTFVSANVNDVARQPSALPIGAPMLVSQFNPSTGSTQYQAWGAADVIGWSASIVSTNAVAVHVASTSIVVPYFDGAVLLRLRDANADALIDAGDEWVVCGSYGAPVLTDNGAHRFWTYTMALPAAGAACHAGQGGFGAPHGAYRVAGVKNGAAMLTPSF